ncbi:MAG: glycoside hydrolase family 127 protein [Lachnospirales bacterium]
MNNMVFPLWKNIEVKDGFWKKWQNTVATSTSNAIYDRFYETGRINAMKLEWKEGMPNKPHEFWDSDIAKWLEGTAYILNYHKDDVLENKLNEIIGYIEKGQNEDGYFNSAFLTLYPEKIFKDRTAHELYTAGHFMEASVAHYYSTGSDRFIKIMCKFADYIEKVFVIDKSATYTTPGHQEIELALVRLSEASKERRYLELSKFFVNMRGTDPRDKVFSVKNGEYPANPPLSNQLLYNDTYAQDNALAKELPSVLGHAVRAMYFCTAMADIAINYDDNELFEACKRLWNDSVNRKMYVTGGVSAERFGEAVGMEYILPNDYSYAETCASVAMANFSQRMLQLEQDGKYADMIEHQMYNGALVGLSIDGAAFFYDNAMRSRPDMNKFFEGIHATPLLPANERLKVFECSCCPPNIYRFIAAIGQYFYSTMNNKLFIHQYSQSSTITEIGGKKVQVEQKTNYPWESSIAISLTMESVIDMEVAIRIPSWCTNPSIICNGKKIEILNEKGYVYLKEVWSNSNEIILDLPMDIIEMESHPYIVNDAGKVALKRGPIVYCLEGVDNKDINIFDVTLSKDFKNFVTKNVIIYDFEVKAIIGKGFVRNLESWDNTLYKPFSTDYKEVEFVAIPYFAWANRGENNMSVWVKKQF